MRRMAVLSLVWLLSAGVNARGQSTWYLSEGAETDYFREAVVVANPTESTLTVTLTLLPQADAIFRQRAHTTTMKPRSRVTLDVRDIFGLNGSASIEVTAVDASGAPGPIVVDRTTVLPQATDPWTGQVPSMHSAGAVAATASRWYFAEGATGAFDTFVLAANPHPTETVVRATYLTSLGTTYTSMQVAPPHGRVTFWPRAEHTALAQAEFATEVESMTPGNGIAAERAQYWDNFGGAHAAAGVSQLSASWYFGQVETTAPNSPRPVAFDTFLLLYNPGNSDAAVTVHYISAAGQTVSRAHIVGSRRRVTVWVDREGAFVDTTPWNQFGMLVESSVPIVAERATYFGPPVAGAPSTPAFPWPDGHATAGLPSMSSVWAFAEGEEGVYLSLTEAIPTTVLEHTYFGVLNATPSTLAVRVDYLPERYPLISSIQCVGPRSQATINPQGLFFSNAYTGFIRFAAVLQSVTSPECPGAVAGLPFAVDRVTLRGYPPSAGHAGTGVALPPASGVPVPR